MKLKMPRELNRSCKLTQKQVDNIPNLRKQGLTFQQIGEKFGVTKTTIWYYTLSPEKRRYNNTKWKDTSPEGLKRKNDASKKARAYKRIVMEKEMKEFARLQSAEFKRKNPEYNKFYLRKFRKKYPDYSKKAPHHY